MTTQHTDYTSVQRTQNAERGVTGAPRGHAETDRGARNESAEPTAAGVIGEACETTGNGVAHNPLRGGVTAQIILQNMSKRMCHYRKHMLAGGNGEIMGIFFCFAFAFLPVINSLDSKMFLMDCTEVRPTCRGGGAAIANTTENPLCCW